MTDLSYGWWDGNCMGDGVAIDPQLALLKTSARSSNFGRIVGWTMGETTIVQVVTIGKWKIPMA